MNFPNTLLTRFYGMHRVKPHKKKEVHFLIFNSVFNTKRYIHQTFDLKGSTQGRSATDSEKKSFAPVLKDNDLIELGVKINVGPQRAKILKQQIQQDVEFLCQQNIMDYSLLVGIHDESRPIPADSYHPNPQKRSSLTPEEEAKVVAVANALANEKADNNVTIATATAAAAAAATAAAAVAAVTSVEATNDTKEQGDNPPQHTRRLSHYALPPEYDQLSHPDDIKFVAPAFPAIDQNQLKSPDRSIEPVQPLLFTDDGGIRSMENGKEGHEIYYLGIIDVLTFYGVRKQMESAAKSMKYKKSTISAVHPIMYAKRFIEFLDKVIV